jgi:hypothetical protein
MNVAAKLKIFSGLFVQDEDLLCVGSIFYKVPSGGICLEQTNLIIACSVEQSRTQQEAIFVAVSLC